MHLSNRLCDLRRGRSLQQIAARPGPDRTKDVVVAVVRREHHDAPALTRETCNAIERGRIGQLEIEEDDVWMERCGQSKTIIDGVGRAHDIDVRVRARVPR